MVTGGATSPSFYDLQPFIQLHSVGIWNDCWASRQAEEGDADSRICYSHQWVPPGKARWVENAATHLRHPILARLGCDKGRPNRTAFSRSQNCWQWAYHHLSLLSSPCLTVGTSEWSCDEHVTNISLSSVLMYMSSEKLQCKYVFLNVNN